MAIKILVIDDESDIQHLFPQEFREEIRQKEYEFQYANNGKEALEILEKNNTFDLILLDINMSVMDGMEFLEKLKEQDDPLLRAIIISAFGDMLNIRKSMNKGAFDFLIKPIDFQDLKTTIKKYLEDLKFRKKALQEHDELVSHIKELARAAKIQAAILPNNFPAFPERKEFDLYARMIPAKKVCGDFYDFFLLDNYRLGIVVGDVEGKGIPAAIFMLLCKNLTFNIALKSMYTDTCLEDLGKEIFKISSNSIYVTIFYGILDTRDGSFEYCCGGHLPPYLISNNGEVSLLENKQGTLVGSYIDDHTNYEANRIILKPGDIIFAFTDGIIEAREKENKDTQQFGEERLKNFLLNFYSLSMEELTSRLIEEVTTFSHGYYYDDTTCLALRYVGKPKE